jgi:hypothetical protein
MSKPTVAVEFIGPRDEWIERRYKSGLTFKPGQIRSVPVELARKLLRHNDLFAEAKLGGEGNVPDKDDTAELLSESQARQDEEQSALENRQGIIDQVMVMDKDALAEFAFTRYQQTLNKRRSVENLREEVAGYVDQFGVV